MTPDPLHDLLKRADASRDVSPPLAAKPLGPHIRRLARRRQQRRYVAATMAFVVGGAALFALFLSHSTVPYSSPSPLVIAPTQPQKPSVPQTAVALLDASYGPDPVADARNDAACTMVLIARRRARNFGPQDAAPLYQRTIALFPETSWATIAREELANLTPEH